jgi:hypothetical protein
VQQIELLGKQRVAVLQAIAEERKRVETLVSSSAPCTTVGRSASRAQAPAQHEGVVDTFV